ncbi:MAG: phosphatase [Opitutaceae bacterium]|jgi:exopolyphosphatase/guanosine-5'-triphosphate,3'-diphosphate pyrophosphatase|nr:phosphatase [Opitutaceae bacterium]
MPDNPPPPPPGPAALVIDVGSNSIKSLVARRAPDGSLRALATALSETRLGPAAARKTTRLPEAAQTAALDAIESLIRHAAPFAPALVRIVATSAVRDAPNAPAFQRRVLDRAGHPLRVLTGEQEAALIGRGVATDPALAGLSNFNIYDLGGGSLEILHCENRALRIQKSLPLGCVRLSGTLLEKKPGDPLAPETRRLFDARVTGLLAQNGGVPPARAHVLCGGSLSALLATLPSPDGAPPAAVTTGQIQKLLDRLAPLPLAKRREIPGVPAARADVLPAALMTMLALARLAGTQRFLHSDHTLRHGVADALLPPAKPPADL